MKSDTLAQELNYEIEQIDLLIIELNSLRNDLQTQTVTTRDVAACAAFLAQFYTGIENILKRTAYFHGIQIPSGENWHLELFQLFSGSGPVALPVFFDGNLSLSMASYRKFRHIVFHSYAFQLDWNRLKEGVDQLEATWKAFRENVVNYINGV